jgi:hypothetical protein
MMTTNGLDVEIDENKVLLKGATLISIVLLLYILIVTCVGFISKDYQVLHGVWIIAIVGFGLITLGSFTIDEWGIRDLSLIWFWILFLMVTLVSMAIDTGMMHLPFGL